MSKKGEKMPKIDGFSKRLKEVMRKRGAIQAKLSKNTNITERAIMKWKYGKTNPTIWNLVEICKFFDVSADWLLGLSDDPNISMPLKDKDNE